MKGNLFSVVIAVVTVWISSISVPVSSIIAVCTAIVVSVWVVISTVSIPGIRIGLSLRLSFGFPLGDSVYYSGTVGVVCIWLGVVISVWVGVCCSMVWVVIEVWMGVDYWFWCLLCFNYFFFDLFLFYRFYYWGNMIIRVTVSVGVWMMVSSICIVVIPGISFGFRLGCSSSK
jgi:hypothetical protein